MKTEKLPKFKYNKCNKYHHTHGQNMLHTPVTLTPPQLSPKQREGGNLI